MGKKNSRKPAAAPAPVEHPAERWRIGFVFLLVGATILAAWNVGWLLFDLENRSVVPAWADADKPIPDIKWGDEFNLMENFQEFLTSIRGQTLFWLSFNVMMFFFAVHIFTWGIFKVCMSKRIYNSLSYRDAFFIGQKIPSSIHGVVVTILAVKIIWLDHVFDSDIIDQYSPLCDVIMGFSLGYEIYDILIMFMQTGAGTGMYIHHLSLCIAFLLSFSHDKMAFVAVIMLITELTVLPSNLHWFLKVFEMKQTRIFHFNQGLRLWSFILLRMPVPLYVAFRIYCQFDDFVSGNPIARNAVFIIVTLLSLMNIYWTKTMLTLYLNRTTLEEEQNASKGKKTK